jgi:putative flippase GtrA
MVPGIVIDPSSTVSARAYLQPSLQPPTATASTRVLAGGVGERARMLLTPEAGLLGQGVRYILGGCTSAGVYILSTTVLALVVGLPFELALAIGFCLMIAVNFTLHRVFVWVNREGFALPLRRQFGRYLSVAGVQYGVTAVSVAVLPRALGLPAEVVYLLSAVSFAAISFTAFRYGVFHAKRPLQSDATVTEQPAR